MGYIRWSEAEVKDLAPGIKLYRSEGLFTWICSVGQVKDYAVYVGMSNDLEDCYKTGHKVRDEVLCGMLFPVIVKAELVYRI